MDRLEKFQVGQLREASTLNVEAPQAQRHHLVRTLGAGHKERDPVHSILHGHDSDSRNTACPCLGYRTLAGKRGMYQLCKGSGRLVEPLPSRSPCQHLPQRLMPSGEQQDRTKQRSRARSRIMAKGTWHFQCFQIQTKHKSCVRDMRTQPNPSHAKGIVSTFCCVGTRRDFRHDSVGYQRRNSCAT